MSGRLGPVAFPMKRSKIVEIVAAKDIVFVLTQTGLCIGYDCRSREQVCVLNKVGQDEVIRSLFYNKANNSLITVSVYRHDNFSSLNCRSSQLEDIENGKPEKGTSIFTTESLKWPGFVEFDDVNGKVLTYSAEDKLYKVWRLQDYSMVYQISDENIAEIKISPGIMLLIFNKVEVSQGANHDASSHVPLKILSIEDGEVLQQCMHVLKVEKKVDFIEQFNEKLLVKQEGENLMILDVQKNTSMEVSSTEFVTPSAFIFLYENQLFLTFKQRSVAVWNFRGELITRFEDHNLWYPDCNTNNIYITSQQDLIVSYCRDSNQDCGSINISNILTGKCMAKLNASQNPSYRSSLEDVTALFYNEERNEIYSGTRNGKLTVWAN